MMNVSQRVKKLKGVVQNYSWGGYDFIPALLGIDNMEQKPYAEYWLGAHANHPAMLEDGIALDHFLKEYASLVLGEAVVTKFRTLPYLLKVLDVRQMLSIQVHPSMASAKKGFTEEHKKGIDIKAAHRNYKDRNHKPEAMVALSDFWLLHGFKKELPMVSVLEKTPELLFLKKIFMEKGYRSLYEAVMTMHQDTADEVLHTIQQRIVPLYQDGQLKKEDEDFWVARAMLDFCREGHYDRGIFSIYLFNLVLLKKGEGIFQGAGLPHAYLEGQNIEVMANSDNVLRAGLTEKHVDIDELMKHVHFEAVDPVILRPGQKEHNLFSVPAEEFQLHQYQWKKEEEQIIQTSSAEIWLLLEGALTLTTDGDAIALKKGESVLVYAGTEVFVRTSGQINLFRATVPDV